MVERLGVTGPEPPSSPHLIIGDMGNTLPALSLCSHRLLAQQVDNSFKSEANGIIMDYTAHGQLTIEEDKVTGCRIHRRRITGHTPGRRHTFSALTFSPVPFL